MAESFASRLARRISNPKMFLLIFTTLLALLSLGVVGILDSSTKVSEFLQFLVICAVVALGIYSIRRYRGNGPFGSKAKE